MFHENEVENTIISLLQEKGYLLKDKNNDQWFQKRNLDEFINQDLLKESLIKINNINNESVIEQAINYIKRLDNPSLFEKNYNFHNILINGININQKDAKINPLIKFIDFKNIENNTFEVYHQIPYQESRSKRIPDIVIYINGIPLIVMELKSFDEYATNNSLEYAYKQLGANSENSGYRYDIPTLFNYNSFLVISDGINTKVGTLTSKLNRYYEWKSIDGEKGYDANFVHKLDVLINGLFDKKRLLDIISNFIFYINDNNDKLVKIMAQYHQYFGVNKALKSIKKALKPQGDGKAGIMWHTQGSGKSYSMVMLAHKLLIDKEFEVPTIVVLTDRIDLDNQLYKTFFSAKKYLKTECITAQSRIDLVQKLSNKKQGGIILTTIGKFDKDNLPSNNRNNIIVMTDEAHRSHYGLEGSISYERNEETDEYEQVYKYGIEKYIRDALPNATFIGFTGTPVSTKEKQTTNIFGEIIDTYDMTQSVIDGATVTISYESRLAQIKTIDEKLKEINNYYDELEKNNSSNKESIERSKQEMSKMKVILENDDVIRILAQDIISHYEQRKNFLNGKVMIVCSTRIQAFKMYKEIISIKPKYKDITILVVTESNKDTKEERELFGNSDYRKEIGNEFKKDTSKYKIAIVCDMWLTGFDVPDLDTMYFIKKLKSHNLMQAIARVNRVYPGKQSGLIVDYIGLNTALNNALIEYTDRDKNKTNTLQDIKVQIYNLLKEKLEYLDIWFKDVNKNDFYSNDSKMRFNAIQEGTEFVLKQAEQKQQEFKDLTYILKNTYISCSTILTIQEKENVLYYLAIRSYLLKLKNADCSVLVSTSDMNEVVSNLLIDAIKGDEVRLLTKQNSNNSSNIIDLLTNEKIQELRKNNKDNIFIQIINNLLERAIKESRKYGNTKSEEYSKKLRKIIEQYNDRDLNFDTEFTIVELCKFTNQMYEDKKEIDKLGLDFREKAFYDILRNEIPKKILNDENIKNIAKELNNTFKENINFDWKEKSSLKSKIRVEIKRLLRKYHWTSDIEKTADNIWNEALSIYDDDNNNSEIINDLIWKEKFK